MKLEQYDYCGKVMAMRKSKNGDMTTVELPAEDRMGAIDDAPLKKKRNGFGAQPVVVNIPRLNKQRLLLTIIGETPLISHAWSKKAKEMILAKQTKKAIGKKEAKDPQRDYEESLYPIPGRDGKYGLPALSFKNAAVNACSFIDGVTKVVARGAIHVLAIPGTDLVEIQGSPKMREDMVRVGMGVADIRYRGEFWPWKVDLEIEYNADALSPQQIVNLFSHAGFSIGVAEWRPQCNGEHGRFRVATSDDVTE